LSESKTGAETGCNRHQHRAFLQYRSYETYMTYT
jgi:hypothetical protein